MYPKKEKARNCFLRSHICSSVLSFRLRQIVLARYSALHTLAGANMNCFIPSPCCIATVGLIRVRTCPQHPFNFTHGVRRGYPFYPRFFFLLFPVSFSSFLLAFHVYSFNYQPLHFPLSRKKKKEEKVNKRTYS